MLGWECARVGFCEPSHQLVVVSVVLFEANKLLLDQHAAPVVHVVRLHAIQIAFAAPHVPAVLLDLIPTLHEGEAANQNNQGKPIGAVLHKVKIAVVVHWVGWLGHLKINLVGIHVSLEFDCILAGNQIGLLVVVLQVVVHVGLVEVSRSS